MKSTASKLTVTFLIIALATGIIAIHNYHFSKSTPAHLLLLVPDSGDTESAKVKVWLDAVEEEGFLVTVMHDSEFLRPWTNRSLYSGIILPDQVHKVASDSLISTLASYVEKGGKLMLVYDAGVWSMEGRYTSNHSRFSDLAGVNYAYYNKLQEKTVTWQPVLGSTRTFAALRIPPGKYHPYDDLASEKTPAIDLKKTQADKTHSISGYENALINYNIYNTGSQYNGEVLLQSPKGDIIAGQRQHGNGTVLFVNLPLGYLKGRTDGLFLHSFLHYFANKIVKLPYLAAVPAGTGGIVMNWHLDSNVTLRPLKRLRGLGLYQQGPYSIHITAGPDSRFVGDKTGVNVPNDKRIQKWIKYFKDKGYQVGSHGGWIHDRFGDHVTNTPTTEFENYLVKNKQALEKVLGAPVTEYSAPKGNHPEWVTGWLSRNNIYSYYFTGNTGMAPTRSYRNGILQNENIWSFPILPYRDMAGFEELLDYKINPVIVKKWLVQTSEFTANTRSIRLIYFHPRGALHYKNAMRAWLAKAEKLQQQKRFRWYTMSEMSKFLTRRSKVQWDFNVDQDIHTISASHPDNLNKLTWVLTADVYGKPRITEGNGVVKNFNNEWVVIAGKGKKLTFTTKAL
ncbi:MAG: hypothetical protein IME93_06680 [Proteobacteria bacterium]|nr:hypothetical protein [Pseudomonadota bacterium]